MKIITVEQARVLDLLPIEEIRPRYGVYLPEFVNDIAQRYSFLASPKDLVAAAKDGAVFQQGRFRIDDADVVIKELGIYSDGIIVDTNDAKMSEIVLDDLYKWGTERFKLSERKTPPRRTFAGVIVFEYEKTLEKALGSICRIGQILSESLKHLYGWEYKYDAQRIGLAVDPANIPHLRSKSFVLGRRVQVPNSSNSSGSGAPLPTDHHIKLLETIERELLSG